MHAIAPAAGNAAGSRTALSEVFNRVSETCDLPPLPAVAMRAMALVRDPDVRADQLVRVVSIDAALAARVLSIARSVPYARRERPRSLEAAIQTVGFEALRRILIAASARSAYRTHDVVAEALWEHALATALAADEIAVGAGEPRGGSAFIAGLMHDIGKLVFHLADRAGFRALDPGDEQREQELFGVTHEQVGACLADSWGLDDDVVWSILSHHRGGSDVPLAAHLGLADRVAYRLGYGCTRAVEIDECADADLAELLDRVGRSFQTDRALFA